ncbi:peptidylprolyl isomerase [Acinetobacter sp. MD2]|uniref:peptidylprolyl isomerase n=1 Tax=Acinetobacter sp. MD2 TaxID=2600066 RepID=UPI002D1EC56E|nr:peptidylprolyl isomerase [Acinetobacter sp. MD2]MEB3766664.1 peptidylprolyl isomerase [Acinetobacter sp. MD2]
MKNLQLKQYVKAATLALLISSSMPVFAASSDEVVAVVGDSAILRSDLDQMTAELAHQLQAQKQQLPSAQVLQQQALEQMITRQAQLELVKRYGVKPDEATLNEEVAKYAKQNGFSSLESFQKQLDAQAPGTYEAVRTRIGQEISISRLRQQQIMSRVKITDQDVDNFLKTPQGQAAIGSQAHILHVRVSSTGKDTSQLLSTAQLVKQDLNQSNDLQAISKKYSTADIKVVGADMGYKSLADIPAELAARVTALQPGQTSETIPAQDGLHILKLLERKASDQKMIVTQYHVRHILIQTNEVMNNEQAKQRIDNIYNRLKAGNDFATLATTFSNDPGSAANGGDLGWVSLGSMVPEFEDTMKSIPVGQISTPFKTQFGWHILQVEQTRQQDMTKEYQERLARQFLGEQQFNTEVDGWLRELRANTYVDIKDPTLKKVKNTEAQP